MTGHYLPYVYTSLRYTLLVSKTHQGKWLGRTEINVNKHWFVSPNPQRCEMHYCTSLTHVLFGKHNVILLKYSSLVAKVVAKMIISDVDNDEYFIKMTTLPFHWSDMEATRYIATHVGPILLSFINFDTSVYKDSHPQWNMGCDYSSIPKRQCLQCWSLGMYW